MSFEDTIQNEYFDWLYEYMCKNKFNEQISYKKLFGFLHSTNFTYVIPRDKNRACDGEELRNRFSSDIHELQALEGPCSVLEMMIALAIRCEENIMDNPNYGDRTSQWFWIMIKNLGLWGMTDDCFDRGIAQHIITKFLNREYTPEGKGNIFYIPDSNDDLRTVEIWAQLCWFLGSM